jgi:hypothetical protein
MGGLAKKPAALSEPEPEFPEQIAYLWDWFGEIIEGCESGFGPAIVTWPALANWASFMRLDLEPWEARTLVRLGTTRAAVLSEDVGDGSHKNHSD